MPLLNEVITQFSNFISSNGCDNETIKAAEDNLNVLFSSEYKNYLSQYGLVCFDGRELTGICHDKRLNVVDVTLEERIKNYNVPANLYVVEQANIDGIIIWQSQNGEVYLTQPGTTPSKIHESLVDYIMNT